MSRTYRNTTEANANARRIRFKNQLTNTLYFCQELREEEYNPRTRDRMLGRRGYLNSRDDHSVAAWSEATPIDKAVKAFLDEKYGSYTWRVKVYSSVEKKTVWVIISTRRWDHDDYTYYFRKFERADKLKKIYLKK